MKEEIRRIMQLVKDGKLSPEDAAELIEAFGASAPREPAPEPGREEPSSGQSKASDPFAGFVEAMEKVGKDVANSVNWPEVATQIRTSARRGVDVLRQAAERARQGRSPFSVFLNVEKRDLDMPFTLPEGKILRVENECGDVRIQGGAPEASAQVSISIKGSSSEDAKAKADAYTLVIEESDGFVLIKQPDVSGLTVDLKLKVPAHRETDLKVESGDVEVSGTLDACRVVGRRGDVRLREVAKMVEVQTASGDVTIADSQVSQLTLDNKSGDINLSGISGSIAVKTASGDVRLRRCAGSAVSIEAVSGDVAVDLSEPVSGAVNVRTVHGDATVAIPDGSSARVALSTIRGDIDCQLDLSDLAKTETRLTGKLGDGLGTIDVSAVNGDVSLDLRATEL